MKKLFFLFFFGITTAFSQSFIGELFPVDSADKVALFNNSGDRTTEWSSFNQVKSEVKLKHFKVERYGRWGLADENLDIKLSTDFQKIYQNGGYIFAEKPSELIILNTKLDTLKTIEDFNRISFPKGFEKKWSRYKSTQRGEFKMIIHTLNGTGLMDKEFNWIIEPTYDDAFWMRGICFTRKGDKFGFVSVENENIEADYKTLGFFNDNVLEFKDFSDHRSYYLKNGKKLPNSDSTLVYDRMYSNYKIYQNGKGELYNYTLNKLVEHTYEDVFQINSGFKNHGRELTYDQKVTAEREFAFLSNGKVGVINEEGSVIIPAMYEHVESAFEGFYIVQLDSLFGVINTNNEFVIAPTFTFIDFYQEYFRVIDENNKGIMNAAADTLVPIIFNEINFEPEGFLTKKNNSKGFYTFEGKRILNPVYQSVHRGSGGLEFRSKKGDCMVNMLGLITPAYCKHPSKTSDKVKYYHNGKIVIKELKEGVLVDSTVYNAPKSIYIEDRWKNSYEVSTDHHSFTTFQNQLNGKYGSKAKKSVEWGVPSIYANVHNIDHSFRVKNLHEESIQFAGQYFTTKEIIAPFYGNNGSREGFLLAYEGRSDSRTWHSSVFDASVNLDQEFEYYSRNYYAPGTRPLILKRFGFNSVSLTQGEFGVDNGERIMTYKDFFEDLNECNNFEIVNKYQFGKVSQNPEITVQNATWKVLMIEENHTYNEVDEFAEYRELESGAALVKSFTGLYNVITAGKEKLIKDGAEEIKVVMSDEYEFYLIKQYHTTSLGSTAVGWSLYTVAGEVFKGFYDDIVVIDYNHFKVTKNNKTSWLDKNGKVITSITY